MTFHNGLDRLGFEFENHLNGFIEKNILHSSHTFSLIADVKHYAFKKTLHNPEFEKILYVFNFCQP